MQERIARDPREALGISEASSDAEVRTAFLALTKSYHPARFARLAPDVQRLANEVFLALRAAHDAASKIARATQPAAATGPIAALAVGTARSGSRPTTQPLARSAAPPSAAASGAFRAPASGAPSSAASSGSFRPTTPASSGAFRAPTSQMPPLQRQAAAPVARTGAVPTQRQAAGRTTTIPVPTRAGAIPAASAPGAKATPSEGTRALANADERDVTSALELLQRGQWDAGRAILQALADKHPETARYRALVSYAMGRQAQLEQRLNEARVELDRALQLDPTLHLAKTALGELFSRRK